MKSKYKTFWWLLTAFTFGSMLKILYYQFLKLINRLDYNKKFKVKFEHEGEWLQFYLRYNRDDFAILRGTFMSRVYDVDIGEVKTIIDAGSHIGCVAIYYAKKYPDAKIYCFEPDEESYNLSGVNAAMNEVDLNIHQIGISNHSGILRFNKNNANPSYSFIGDKGKGRKIPITVESLDKIFKIFNLKQVDILKLDIEGHEPQAFEGMAKTKHKIKHILLENHSAFYSLEKIKKIIKDNGYEILPELPIWEKLYGMKDTMFLLKR